VLGQRVVRVERQLARAGDLDDASRGVGLQPFGQASGKVVRRQVVDGEPELDPVGAQLASGTRLTEPDTGVVDQDRQVGMPLEHRVGETVDLPQRGQVRLDGEDPLPRGALDLGHEPVELLGRPTVCDDGGAVIDEAVDQCAAESGGRSGDEDGLLFHWTHGRTTSAQGPVIPSGHGPGTS
jgi:hypothetical protein